MSTSKDIALKFDYTMKFFVLYMTNFYIHKEQASDHVQ